MEGGAGITNNRPALEKCHRAPDYFLDPEKSEKASILTLESPNVSAAVVWERLSIGCRIVDLTRGRFNEALQLAKNDFFACEPMCRATQLAKDKTSVYTYLDLITVWTEEMQSMCAIDEGSGKLVGIAVATVNSKADQLKTDGRIRMSQGEAIFKILSLKSCVFGLAQLYEKYEIDEYFRLHVLCVASAFRNRGIGTALVRSCVDRYRRLQLPACVGAFTSGAAQNVVERLGFETLADIPYRDYVTPGKTEKPFADVGVGNYSIACMGIRTSRSLAPSTLSSPATAITATAPSAKPKNKKS